MQFSKQSALAAGNLTTTMKRLGGMALVALLVALAACSTSPFTSSGASSKPIAQGQKYVMATHSFNVFIGPSRPRDGNADVKPGPLAALAEERGKKGHESLAVQMIGGSTPMQHWNQGDGDDSKNIAKVALKKGGVDVFTMSPNARMPEEGIDLFGDLVIKTNPNARILVQNSWSAWDGNGTTPSVGGTRNVSFSTEDHNKADIATIDTWLAALEAKDGYMQRMRAQLDGINKRAGHQITYVVPSAVAVYTLRKEILKGTVPGVKVQADIFRDGMGHPKTPLANLVTYAWFAAMYRESPIGLHALIDANDPTSAARERMLQQIAWNAVIAEPMSGVKGKPVKIDPKS
jgi:hypothetical protein